LFEVDQESCWLTGVPTISAAGQIAFEVDAAFVLTFHAWLVASLTGKKVALDGAISSFDHELNEQQRFEFKSSTVTSFGFPPLDAASHTDGHMTLTLQAKILTPTPGSGKPAAVSAKPVPWRVSDFRLVIDKVNTSKVSRIDAIHMTIPGPLPKVNVLVPAMDVKQFIDWQNSGASAASKIHFLGPDLSRPLFTLSFTSKVHSIAYSTNGGASHSRKRPGLKTKVPVALTVTAPMLSKG
jgi:hypothetical protein